MISRMTTKPAQFVARRHMSFGRSAYGSIKQDLAAAQKNNLQMDLRWTFLRGGRKDDVIVGIGFLMGFGIICSVARGFYKMSTGQKK